MENSEFFSNVDSMLSETLSVKSLKNICEEFKQEVESNRGEYKNNFDMALKMGEKGERIVRMFLENLGYIFVSKCENISHDYKFVKGGKEGIFEIKTDVAHLFVGDDGNLRDTGNIAIEYESRGNKSGIAATNADFFVTYYPQLNEIWLIKTEKLKDIIRANKDTIKKVEGGDTNSRTKMFLLKREKFKSEFRVTNVYNENE
jgi:hypothetical protein